MTTIRKLKLAAGAGDPDEALALRIDVVAAALAWYDAGGNALLVSRRATGEFDDAEDKLERAVRRYKAAVKRREHGRG